MELTTLTNRRKGRQLLARTDLCRTAGMVTAEEVRIMVSIGDYHLELTDHEAEVLVARLNQERARSKDRQDDLRSRAHAGRPMAGKSLAAGESEQ